jgi:hypothetical protein
MGLFFHLFYPYGIILQVLAIVHFVRRRPETYWLWIIFIGGPIGALAYIVAEVLPDLGLLQGAFQRFPRRRRIHELEAAVLDNPSPGNFEELGALHLDEKNYARARECYSQSLAARTDHPDPFYRRAIAEMGLADFAAAAADLERVVAVDPRYDHWQAKARLAQCYAMLGRGADAERLFREVLEFRNESEIQYNFASMLLAEGRIQDASEWAERILQKKKTLPRYLKRLERSWFRKASALLKKAREGQQSSTATVASNREARS